MALHLEEVPEFRCTINLVPSLLAQLDAYVHGATDTHLTLSRRPADGLDAEDACSILDNFFMAFADTMIRPHARYQELYLLRSSWNSSARAGAGPLPPARPPRLAGLVEPGVDPPAALREGPRAGRVQGQGSALHRGRQGVVPGPAAIAARPGHPAASRAGRARPGRADDDALLSPDPPPALRQDVWPARRCPTSPCRPTGAAIPRTPRSTSAAPSRATPSVSARGPRGMWPSEGSVCQAMIPLLAEHGIEWIATDEEILGCSTHGKVGRDSRGHVRNPELLYRPWKVREGDSELAIIFRDHSMSDQVGFHYQRSPGPVAAGRLPRQGARHRRRLPAPTRRPWSPSSSTARTAGNISPTAASRSSARSTRPRCATPGSVRSRVDEFLREHPPKDADTVPRLFSGSWISHNFAIWIGHPEDNRGWDALHTAREFLVAEERSGRHDPTALARAWEEIYIAEGSDWFWWYGDDHSSALDGLFDHFFRKHLRNVYALLGCDPPGSLFTPISRGAVHRPLHDQPLSFLNVKLDGRATYFEWIDAARYVCGNDRGTMTLVARGVAPHHLVRLRRRTVADPHRHRGRPGARAARRGRPPPHRLRRPGRVGDPRHGPRDAPAGRLPEPARPPDGQRHHGRGRHRDHPRAGRPLRPARTQAGRSGPVLRRAPRGRLQPRPGAPRRDSSS